MIVKVDLSWNHYLCFDDFLAEELTDPYSSPGDADVPAYEPFEKECHPVPIDLIVVSAI